MSCTVMALAGLFWMIGTENSSAQRFEWVYGGNSCNEDGRFRVIPVTGGCGQNGDCMGGYIAVGTSYSVDPDCGSSDVYVVRINNCGQAFWEKTYDISGSNLNDEGWSIIEVTNEDGFIITGSTTSEAGDLNAFLMEIDCMGVPQWTTIYGDQDGNQVGRDLIEAKSGNPRIDPDTRAGDIIVAGRSDNSGTLDGYLFRARRAGGALVWDATYNGSGQDEWFNSLTEAKSSGINRTPTGDIVAVGGRDIDAYQGYIVRVNGDDGSITSGTGSAQNSAEYGQDAYDDEFFSVIELQNPEETGERLGFPNVVVAGYGSVVDAAGFVGIESFVVKLSDGNPCTPMTQVMIGDGTGSNTDRARTIRELPATLGLNSQYDLIMTGVTDVHGTDDVYLLSLRPNLTPSGVVGRTYGGDDTDEGWSTYPVYEDGIGHMDGFIVCGLSQSDLAGTGDPQDMYLIKTDARGSSGCDNDYGPEYQDVYPWSCLTEDISSINSYTDWQTEYVSQEWGDEVCACQSPKSVPTTGQESNNLLTQVSVQPNPARDGDELTLSIVSHASTIAQLSATNSLGEEVLSRSLILSEGTNEASIRSADWPAGVYHITLREGDRSRTLHVVITD